MKGRDRELMIPKNKTKKKTKGNNIVSKEKLLISNAQNDSDVFFVVAAG